MRRKRPTTAADVLRLLDKLPPEELPQLLRLAAERNGIPLQAVQLNQWAQLIGQFAGACVRTSAVLLELLGRQQALTDQRRAYAQGPQAKQRRVELRNQAIDSFLAQGIGQDGDPTAAVYAFLMENHPDLLHKGRDYVSAESVMKVYWRSRNGAG
jgi:hypothetical protein